MFEIAKIAMVVIGGVSALTAFVGGFNLVVAKSVSLGHFNVADQEKVLAKMDGAKVLIKVGLIVFVMSTLILIMLMYGLPQLVEASTTA